jgi:hypothetical protein
MFGLAAPAMAGPARFAVLIVDVLSPEPHRPHPWRMIAGIRQRGILAPW